MSCGCLQREKARATRRTHGEGSAIHRVDEYVAWQKMRARCLNPRRPDYPDYGGRGIRICDRWERYECFLADLGRKPSKSHSLDRIDVNGHYEPGNVKWSTPTEQARNKRNTIMCTYHGETKPLVEWSEIIGITHSALYRRIAKGLAVDDAFSRPRNAKKAVAR